MIESWRWYGEFDAITLPSVGTGALGAPPRCGALAHTCCLPGTEPASHRRCELAYSRTRWHSLELHHERAPSAG